MARGHPLSVCTRVREIGPHDPNGFVSRYKGSANLRPPNTWPFHRYGLVVACKTVEVGGLAEGARWDRLHSCLRRVSVEFDGEVERLVDLTANLEVDSAEQ